MYSIAVFKMSELTRETLCFPCAVKAVHNIVLVEAVASGASYYLRRIVEMNMLRNCKNSL